MGLDENLPSFHITDPKDSTKLETSYLLTRGGHDPEPAYTLKRPDPSSPTTQNCYAAALFDAYNPDVLYGEVLIRPRWTHPTLNQEEIRRNGGIPPPPEPILPTEFTIQLYNPDLQIEVKREQSTFGGTHYDFAIPQETFRLPSSSALDRSQHDPAAALTTPKVNFAFKREGKLTKDMVLHMTGRSTDVVHKKRNKEPDISIALFKALREVTIYEPNLYRVDMEDPKGLEVTILLLATVIKDVYHAPLRTAFNVTDESARRRRRSSSNNGFPTTAAAAGRKSSDPSNVIRKDPGPGDLRKQPSAMMSGGLSSHPTHPTNLQAPSNPNLPAGAPGLYTHSRPAASTSNLPDRTRPPRKSDPGPPITDPRTQWQIDAETARLRQQTDAERQAEEQRRREQARRDEAESKKLRKQLEAEERERRQKQKEVEKETARLRKIYGVQQAPGAHDGGRQGAHSAPVHQGPFPQRPGHPGHSQMSQQGPSYPMQQRPPAQQQQQRPPQPRPQHVAPNGMYPAGGGSSAFNAGASVGNLLGVGGGGGGNHGRKSMWNLRSKSEEQNKLKSKGSSVW